MKKGRSIQDPSLFHRGLVRLDTDTALSNAAAQRYYERNRFTREGLTRSYYKDAE